MFSDYSTMIINISPHSNVLDEQRGSECRRWSQSEYRDRATTKTRHAELNPTQWRF